MFVESTDTLANGQALDAVVREQGAIKGILITTSRFGPESVRFAQGKPLEPVDGEWLQRCLATYLDVKA